MEGYRNSGSVLGAGSASDTPQRETEVSSQTRQLLESVERLDSAAKLLCERLSAVQRMDGPITGAENKSAPEPVLCPMATALRTIRATVERATSTLDTNRSRLEI